MQFNILIALCGVLMGTGKTWTYNEQRVLCSKYIAVSEDPSTGNGQKSSEFWGKITLLVNEGRAPEHERTVAAVKSHFQDVISPKVSKFMGYMKKVLLAIKRV